MKKKKQTKKKFDSVSGGHYHKICITIHLPNILETFIFNYE